MLGLGIGLVVLGVVLFVSGVVSQVLRLKNTVAPVGKWIVGGDDPERDLEQLQKAAGKAAGAWSAGSLVLTTVLVLGGVGTGIVGVVLVAVALVRG